MANIYYVIPWAICDTNSMYVKVIEKSSEMKLDEKMVIDEWQIKKIKSHPDKRKKDIYVILDVYNGYDFKEKRKDIDCVALTNSKSNVKKYGYKKISLEEKKYIEEIIIGKKSKKVNSKKSKSVNSKISNKADGKVNNKAVNKAGSKTGSKTDNKTVNKSKNN